MVTHISDNREDFCRKMFAIVLPIWRPQFTKEDANGIKLLTIIQLLSMRADVLLKMKDSLLCMVQTV